MRLCFTYPPQEISAIQITFELDTETEAVVHQVHQTGLIEEWAYLCGSHCASLLSSEELSQSDTGK